VAGAVEEPARAVFVACGLVAVRLEIGDDGLVDLAAVEAGANRAQPELLCGVDGELAILLFPSFVRLLHRPESLPDYDI
jgi:hypothetical protein